MPTYPITYICQKEYKLLNRGLKFGIFPSKFNYIGIQTEFEDLYQQVRPSLNNDERIEFKSKLMTLYHKYKSSFYYERKRNEAGLTQDENETLEKPKKFT